MNSHKNARLTFEGRKLLIERLEIMGPIAAAQAAGTFVKHHSHLTTANTYSTRARTFDLLRFLARSASSIPPPLRTR